MVGPYQRFSPPPPRPPLLRARPDPDEFATSTFSVRPSTIWPLNFLAAASASSAVAISTKPKPRERPVSRSVTAAAVSTAPAVANSSRRRSSDVEKDRPPMNNLCAMISLRVALPQGWRALERGRLSQRRGQVSTGARLADQHQELDALVGHLGIGLRLARHRRPALLLHVVGLLVRPYFLQSLQLLVFPLIVLELDDAHRRQTLDDRLFAGGRGHAPGRPPRHPPAPREADDHRHHDRGHPRPEDDRLRRSGCTPPLPQAELPLRRFHGPFPRSSRTRSVDIVNTAILAVLRSVSSSGPGVWRESLLGCILYCCYIIYTMIYMR